MKDGECRGGKIVLNCLNQSHVFCIPALLYMKVDLYVDSPQSIGR